MALRDESIIKVYRMSLSPLELALKYMNILFNGQNMEELAPLLSKDFSFKGSLYEFNSPQSYIESLKSDPPVEFKYKIIHSFESSSSVGLFYLFSKPGFQVHMAQLFEIRNDKISKILLIFDSKVFS